MKRTIKAKHLPLDDLSNLFSQLAMLLKEGLGIEDALGIVQHGWERPAMQSLVTELYAGVGQGKRLSQLFSSYTKLLPPFLIEYLERAEKEGRLPEAAAEVASYLQATATLDMDRSGALRSTFFYPLAVLTVMLLISTVLMIFVIPQFESVFDNFGAQLPLLTQQVIHVSHGVEHYWPLIIAAVVIIALMWRYGIRYSARLHYLALRLLALLPGYGALYLHSRAARLLHTWGFLLGTGYTLQQAVAASAQLPLGPYYQNMLQRLSAMSKSGSPLYQLLDAEMVIPKRVVQVVAVGARLSSAHSLFHAVAEHYTGQLEKRVRFMASLQEVILITLLALVIGTLVIAMYLPIFKLGEVV